MSRDQVAVEEDDVGALAGLEAADPVGAAEKDGAVEGGDADRLGDGEAGLVEQLDVALVAEAGDDMAVAGRVARRPSAGRRRRRRRARTPSPCAASSRRRRRPDAGRRGGGAGPPRCRARSSSRRCGIASRSGRSPPSSTASVEVIATRRSTSVRIIRCTSGASGATFWMMCSITGPGADRGPAPSRPQWPAARRGSRSPSGAANGPCSRLSMPSRAASS